MSTGKPGQRPSDIRNRLRRNIEAKELAVQAVLEAARPFAEVTSPARLAHLTDEHVAKLRQAFQALDALE